MDKKLVAQNIRRHLERRLSTALGCAAEDLGKLKLGTLIHLSFLFHGDQECISGFSTCIRGVIELIGHEIVWADPAEESGGEQSSAVQIIN
jgi:hypothetical protein